MNWSEHPLTVKRGGVTYPPECAHGSPPCEICTKLGRIWTQTMIPKFTRTKLVLRFVAVALMLTALVLFGLAMVGCARPSPNTDQRIRALEARGVNTAAVKAELRGQENKFALFRSYKFTDEMLTALENGAPEEEVRGLASGYMDSRCVDKFTDETTGIVCFRDACRGGISCVKP